jgi:hypothetical protein
VKEILKLGFILALVLCIHDALAQEAARPARIEIPMTGQADPFKPKWPIKQADPKLGEFARSVREAHERDPKAEWVWIQQGDGKIVSVKNPNRNASGTVDVVLK